MSQTTVAHSLKNEIKDTVSLSVPLVTSQIVYASSGFIGTAMVAQLGENALAAGVLVTMIWITLSVAFFGLLNSVGVLVSHQYGAKNNQAISEIMGQAFILGAFVIGLIIALLAMVPFFLRYTAQPPAVLELAIQYMHALLWTTPGLIILVICEQFLAGVNRTKMVLRISLLVVPVEIPLIYMLIFGKFGLPACGVAGIGYGFAITYSTTAALLCLYLMKSKPFLKFGIFSSFGKMDWRWLKELIRVGLPMGFMHLIEVSTFAVATFWIAQFGTTLLAAHQIVLQFLNFFITVVFGMSQAVTIRVGHAVGSEDVNGIRLAIYIGMLLNFILIAIFAVGFILFPQIFLKIDINVHNTANALLVRDASALLTIGGVVLLFDNFRIIGFGALRGLKDTKFAMYSSFLAFWLIGLTSAFLLGFTFHFQGKGIWWGLVFGIASGAIIVFIRLQWLLNRVDVKKLMEIK